MFEAFPMQVDPTEAESDRVLAPYSLLEEDNSYYICAVALFPEVRGNGVGSQFMALAEQKARENKLNKLSLIVFEHDSGAK
jgi:GNAT superfamily N-acetyltransferase